MRAGRRRGAVFACLAVACATAMPHASATRAQSPFRASCADRATVIDLPDGWTRVAAPDFPEGTSREIVDYAVVPNDHRVIFATNGRVVLRTVDGGCTWQDAYDPNDSSLPAAKGYSPSLAADREIIDLQVTWADVGVGVGWLLSKDRVTEVLRDTPVIRPRVSVTRDGGRTWVDASVGLPSYGEPVALRVATMFPGVAFVAVRDVPTKGVALFATRDSGATWERLQTAVDLLQSSADFDDFVVSPRDVRELWAWGRVGLASSTDGGQHFRAVPVLNDAVTAVDILTTKDGTRVRAFHASGISRYSDDEGRNWFTTKELGAVTSVASIPVAADLYVTSSSDGVRIVRGRGIADVTPADGTRFHKVSLTGGVDPLLYGMTPTALYRRPLAQLKPTGTDLVGALRAARPASLGKPSLGPDGLVVDLPAGGSTRVDYTLRLPPSPTPLDVFFLSDTTGSMAPVIRSLRRDFAGIVNDLADAGIGVWFGVADFREYAEPYGLGSQASENYPYRLGRKIGPVDIELGKALNLLTTGGGASDGSDSALEALYQAATGAGRYVVSPVQAGTLIAPGLDAGFRDDSVRVMVLATDTAWRDAEPGYPGPDRETVFRALVDEDVHVVGLAFGDPDRPPSNGQVGGPGDNLRAVAEATGTFAPEGGVDCDEDGELDIGADEPLMCVIPDSNFTTSLASAMVAMLRAVEDRAAVDVRVVAGGSAARTAGPAVFPAVDVKQANRLTVPVEFRCAPDRAGTTTRVSVQGRVRGDVVASANATLRCGVAAVPLPTPVAPPPEQPVRERPAVVVVPPPVQAPPPAQQPQLNPNAQVNPNAGFAPQDEEQEQHQVADEHVTWDDGSLAMSRRDEAAAPALLLGAALLGAAFGTGHALSRRRAAGAARVRPG